MSVMEHRTKTRRRLRRRTSSPDPHATIIGCFVLLASGLFLVLLYKAQEILDSIATRTDFRMSAKNILKRLTKKAPNSRRTFPTNAKSKYNPPSDLSKPPSKFLIFDSNLGGQGTGNVVSGLLSAHLLALEFGRIVCTDYPSLRQAFEPAHPWAIEHCPRALKDAAGRKLKRIILVNYELAPDECRLKRILGSDETFVVMLGNTYPRWPLVPDNLFFTYYRPKPEFLEILPYDPASPPRTVVHLRQPDGEGDARKGLDDESLKALGKALPSDTYLVTNRVAWYDYFESNFRWRHPGWQTVQHSAVQELSWGRRKNQKVRANRAANQTLQMWADWYVMLTAEKVYHTHSDFSISAIHWMNLDSLSLQGMENGRLKVVNESWRVDGETVPLVERTTDGLGNAKLRLCGTGAR